VIIIIIMPGIDTVMSQNLRIIYNQS